MPSCYGCVLTFAPFPLLLTGRSQVPPLCDRRCPGFDCEAVASQPIRAHPATSRDGAPLGESPLQAGATPGLQPRVPELTLPGGTWMPSYTTSRVDGATKGVFLVGKWASSRGLGEGRLFLDWKHPCTPRFVLEEAIETRISFSRAWEITSMAAFI